MQIQTDAFVVLQGLHLEVFFQRTESPCQRTMNCRDSLLRPSFDLTLIGWFCYYGYFRAFLNCPMSGGCLLTAIVFNMGSTITQNGGCFRSLRLWRKDNISRFGRPVRRDTANSLYQACHAVSFCFKYLFYVRSFLFIFLF